jgi:hypothetical protein
MPINVSTIVDTRKSPERHRLFAVSQPSNIPASGSLRDMPTELRQARRPLLCELHAHSTWSDGELELDRLAHL